VAEQNPVWNNRAVPYLEKKKNNSAEKEGVLSLSFPSLLPETRKMET